MSIPRTKFEGDLNAFRETQKFVNDHQKKGLIDYRKQFEQSPFTQTSSQFNEWERKPRVKAI